jgi:hypothetical protein
MKSRDAVSGGVATFPEALRRLLGENLGKLVLQIATSDDVRPADKRARTVLQTTGGTARYVGAASLPDRSFASLRFEGAGKRRPVPPPPPPGLGQCRCRAERAGTSHPEGHADAA